MSELAGGAVERALKERDEAIKERDAARHAASEWEKQSRAECRRADERTQRAAFLQAECDKLNDLAHEEGMRAARAERERDAYLRAAGEQVDLRVAADKERDEATRAKERLQVLYEQVSRELAEARHAKAQMELRWQAAGKECTALRVALEAKISISKTMLGLVRPDERCMCQTTCVECEKCR